MLKKIILTLFFTTLLFSNDARYAGDGEFVKKEFLIVKSTKDYNEARIFAKRIAKRLKQKVDLRGLIFHKQNFLTFSQKECVEFEYPCYFQRGRYDDGEYVSIEHTNYYDEFKDGYYIVVVASGHNLSKSLKKVQKEIADAYIKKATVYMGCIH